jgi:hypothetical protein
MTTGICILAHSHLYRVAELARHFAEAGCRVAIHVDSATNASAYASLKERVLDLEGVIFAERIRCEWGTFALHDAGLQAAQSLVEHFDDVTHVALISGSCLPIRPIAELQDFLAAHPDTDFVQSKRLGQDRWVQEGLEAERFTLYHPFSWRKHRWLFDQCVEWQRRFGISRKTPTELELSIGSQWWTLSRGTLERILYDPRKAEWDAFFKHCWIVDESYVQTLARKHSKHFVDLSLTLTEFDPQGKPFTFYDDHAQILEASDKFFARKVWHGANALYSKYLYGAESIAAARRAEKLDLHGIIEQGRERRCRGRSGLLSMSRFPCQGFEMQHATARPYLVLDGYENLFSDLHHWLTQLDVDMPHGRIFDAASVQLHPDVANLEGSITDEPKIRDWNPEQFLTSLLWFGRDYSHSFHFTPGDSLRMSKFILKDPNATIFSISGAWMMSLTQSMGESDEEFRRRALRLKAADEKFNALVAANTTRATVIRFSLDDVIAEPEIALHALGAEKKRGARLQSVGGSGALPRLRADLDHALRRLAACGIDTDTIAALHSRKKGAIGAARRLREAVK